MRGPKRIRDVAAVVQKRIGFSGNSVDHIFKVIENRASCPVTQASIDHAQQAEGSAKPNTIHTVVILTQHAEIHSSQEEGDCEVL